MIQVRVAMMALDASGSPVLLLKPADEAAGGVMLPIWIGPVESTAIMIAAGMSEGPGRPLTYDLMAGLLGACEAEIERVDVTDLIAGTFHAAITLQTPVGPRVVDARPSDSIALALRVGAPIFVADHVLELAAIPDISEDADETLAAFNEFLEDVDPDDFRN